MAKKILPGALKTEAARALWTIAFASALGILVNVYSPRPLAIFSEPPKPLANVPAPLVKPTKMSVQELIQAYERNEAIVLLDVRGKVEYDFEHAPSALHVPLNALMQKYQQIAPNLQGASTIVAFCDSEECGKAEEAAELLAKLGYKNVRVLQGGWEAYRQTDLPRVVGAFDGL